MKERLTAKPPRVAEWLLGRFLLLHNASPVLGDFEELYNDMIESRGRTAADLWYWFQLVKSFPGFVLGYFYWGFVLFRSYLKVTLRSIMRHKGFSFINIFGLALGLSCTLFISLWVLDELSFDRFHTNTKRLYRVEADEEYSGYSMHTIVSPPPLAPVLADEVPEVEAAARFSRFGGLQLRYGDHSFFEQQVRATDPTFFRMFSFPLLRGEPDTALNDPFSIVISQRMATKYFGEDDPLGAVIQAENRFDLMVTGVIQDPPGNSTLQYDWIVPFVFVEQNLRRMPAGWEDAISTFVLLREGVEPDGVAPKITELILRNKGKPDRTVYGLASLARLRLFSVYGRGELMGTVKYVYIFSLIALFVIVIACINFMNLSTARSAQRAKEIGMRKVVGAQRRDLIRQFYGESLLYTLCALGFAVLGVIVLLPVFRTVSGKSISLDSLGTRPILLAGVALTFLTAILAGSYPALLLSSLRPARVLRRLGKVERRSVIRSMLVVVQFSLSIFLIIATVVVYTQTRYMKGSDLGYDRNQLLTIPLRGEVGGSYPALKDRLRQEPSIIQVTAMGRRPAMIGDYARDATWAGKDPDQETRVVFAAVDYEFVETMGLELVEGRTFSRDFATDAEQAFLINQETAKLIGGDSAVGTPFTMFGQEGTVIGVLQNFHFQPLRREIQPLVFLLAPNPHWLGNIVVRFSPENTAATLTAIEKAWKEVLPTYPFEYVFVDEDYSRFYWREERMGQLLGNFSFLAVFIACLGLFGLASFVVEQKTKEIGIRKVLGASVSSIMISLCGEFVRLVVISTFIAWPLAYLAAHSWLDDFAYRIRLDPFVFLLTGLLALIIALLTVSLQAARAARANPVDALQCE